MTPFQMLPSTVSTTSTSSTFERSRSSANDDVAASSSDAMTTDVARLRDGMAGSFAGRHDLDAVAIEEVAGEVVERRARDQRVGGSARGEQACFVELGLPLEHEHVGRLVGAEQRELGIEVGLCEL